jgi:DNA-binding XRE family transcriptional regulator
LNGAARRLPASATSSDAKYIFRFECDPPAPTTRIRIAPARLLANPKVKAEYDALAPEFEISAELVRARLRAGLLQAELAARMGTSQSTIARLESSQTLPSTKTLRATPRRRAASSACGFRRPEAAFANGGPRNRTKSHGGAPRSMKMGNIPSP